METIVFFGILLWVSSLGITIAVFKERLGNCIYLMSMIGMLSLGLFVKCNLPEKYPKVFKVYQLGDKTAVIAQDKIIDLKDVGYENYKDGTVVLHVQDGFDYGWIKDSGFVKGK